MPEYSPVEEIDQSKPLDMSNVKYSAGTIFNAAASNVYHGYTTRSLVNNLSSSTPKSDVPLSQPANQEFVDNLKKDRPGFNPPVGLPQFVVMSLSDQYDNDAYFQKVSSRPASWMGKVGSMAGGFLAGFADPKQFVYAVSGAGAAEKILAPLAESYLAKLATNKIIGDGVAKVGTAISNQIITGAGMGFAGQLSQESDEYTENEILGLPHNYISSLQNLGRATLYGAIAQLGFHGGARALGFGRNILIGKKVEISPELEISVAPDEQFTAHNRYGTEFEAQLGADLHQESTPIKYDYQIHESREGDYILSKKSQGGVFTKPAEYSREGGLLQKLNVPERTKQVLEKAYRPWTKAADDVTKTEAVSQMANGNLVDIEPVIKQGMHDQGVVFREELAKENIDIDALDNALQETQNNLLKEIQAPREIELPLAKEGERAFYRGYSSESPYPSESTIFQDSEFGKGYWYGESKEHAKRYGKNIDELRGKFNIYDVNTGADAEINNLYQEILDEKKNIESQPANAPQAILKSLVDAFRNIVKEKGYEGISRIEKAEHGDLSGRRETMFFEKPKTPEQIQHQIEQKRIADLVQQHALAQIMRDSINDAHPPLTQGEMQTYAKNLQESNMPPTGQSIDAGENYKLDEQLAQYSDEDIKTLAEITDQAEAGGKEIVKSAEKLNNQKVYESMAQQITDCIMKGGL